VEEVQHLNGENVKLRSQLDEQRVQVEEVQQLKDMKVKLCVQLDEQSQQAEEVRNLNDVNAEFRTELEKQHRLQMEEIQHWKNRNVELHAELGNQSVRQEEAAALKEAQAQLRQLESEQEELQRKGNATAGRGLGCTDDSRTEELQQLLDLSHDENRQLREEIHQQAEEIELLEERVLASLHNLRDEDAVGGRRRDHCGVRPSSLPPKAALGSPVLSPGGRSVALTPPRRPGEVRRLPPQARGFEKQGMKRLVG